MMKSIKITNEMSIPKFKNYSHGTYALKFCCRSCKSLLSDFQFPCAKTKHPWLITLWRKC